MSVHDRLFEEKRARKNGPVECLGMSFESDAARREYYIERLREKLRDPEFRKIEGFPKGSDEDILALSDPPFYTACPNPFVGEFVEFYGSEYDSESDEYRREPFAADVSEGKNDPIYNAHSYHTKVPHKAIMRYILHYTEPGDIVFDGFCGTGMTGVAAQLSGDRKAVEALGYRTTEDGAVLDDEGREVSRLGARRAVLNDLSPAATFIAYNYNTPVDVEDFEREARQLLDRFEIEYGWMYKTRHTDGSISRINYVVWSDVFVCDQCQSEVVFWNAAVEEGEVKDEIRCPNCTAIVSKKSLGRSKTTVFDQTLNQPVERAKRIPVIINYSVGKSRFEKTPDGGDFATLQRIENESIPAWYPTRRIDEDIDLWYERDYRSLGIYSVDAFFGKRNLIMVSFFRREIVQFEGRLRGFLWFWFQSVLMGFTVLNRYLKNAFSQVNRLLSGTLYVGAMQSEVSPWYALEGKIKRLRAFEALNRSVASVSTGSTGMIDLPDNSIDYVFTDPPFGSNIIYSDLSIIWESWLNNFTNTEREAVVHRRKKTGSSLDDYTALMSHCFEEYHRVLKPGRWMTVEFHNSKNSVWNAIQESLQRAGFVVADVRTLDKGMGSFKQVTAAAAVKQDLVISAYKPNEELERRFGLEAGTEGGVWDFVESHLRQLPVVVEKDGAVEPVAERMGYLLFDRMVAFHVQRGVSVPLSAAEFYAGLKQRYPERDGMYFVPDHVTQYDRKRVKARELLELQLFITGESSAIQWLRQELTKKPQTFQELSPEFMKDLGWAKHEKSLELGDLLKENFLRYKEGDLIPHQILSWMKQSAKHRPKIAAAETQPGGIPETGLTTHDPEMIVAAKDRWYVPDPNRAQDLEKLRDAALLKEFETYRHHGGKRLKVFRLEAVRAGFGKAWRDREYGTIIEVAKKVPENVLQEDPKLLMYYDNALDRTEDTA